MAGLTNFFNPKSVAVIGASKSPGKIGNVIVKNIIASGYPGKIFPVNLKEREIEGLASYPSISSTPGPAELAIISIPAASVLDVAEECGKSGVKSLVVITAGFKETGKEGLRLERKLVEICRLHKMRMVGPNCVGLMDTHAPINASFAAGFPLKGEIAFISQSGAMLVAILDWSYSAGLGFSKFISLGNKADLTESHFIEDAANDPNTKVILCYIEDVEDGSFFLEVARRASREKPIIILKSGTSQAGARAASSHTGALAGSNLAYEAAFRQCGVIRAGSMPELFDLAVAFASQPAPGGERVAIITNSGGPGIIAADNVELRNLRMARFTKETAGQLRENLPAESNIYNPVDVLGDAKADRYRFAMEKVMADQGVDSAVVLLCAGGVTEPVETARAIIDMRKTHPEKPLIAAYMGGEQITEGARVLSEAQIPCFTFPEPAISSISGLVEYSRIKIMPAGEENLLYDNINPQKVRNIFNKVQMDKRLVLLGSEAAGVVAAYGIPAAATVLATQPEEAAELAGEMGYPVALKVASPRITHKTDVGGVKTGLESYEKVRTGFIEIMEKMQRYMPHVAIHGVEVQKMMPKGTELIIGMTKDVQFGPLIIFGLGGIYVNLIKDVSFRLANGLTVREIKKMLAETKAYTLLRGYRGEKPADIGAIIEVIGRFAKLVTDFPEITEVDINPVIAYNRGVSAVDVKITIS
ncbi:MAG: succinyl-CoA synthetase subunit alpha [Pelotomaculum sp. PtaU1.Bin035]|nr:MAG: succinyl-CoA synthetase subunit alpha [Pelotomaculum sp. PtaU1.Bin035]